LAPSAICLTASATEIWPFAAWFRALATALENCGYQPGCALREQWLCQFGLFEKHVAFLQLAVVIELLQDAEAGRQVAEQGIVGNCGFRLQHPVDEGDCRILILSRRRNAESARQAEGAGFAGDGRHQSRLGIVCDLRLRRVGVDREIAGPAGDIEGDLAALEQLLDIDVLEAGCGGIDQAGLQGLHLEAHGLVACRIRRDEQRLKLVVEQLAAESLGQQIPGSGAAFGRRKRQADRIVCNLGSLDRLGISQQLVGRLRRSLDAGLVELRLIVDQNAKIVVVGDGHQLAVIGEDLGRRHVGEDRGIDGAIHRLVPAGRAELANPGPVDLGGAGRRRVGDHRGDDLGADVVPAECLAVEDDAGLGSEAIRHFLGQCDPRRQEDAQRLTGQRLGIVGEGRQGEGQGCERC
jgi:hypothetical protein